MTYILQGFFMHKEEDSYEHGCLFGTGFAGDYRITLKAETKEELIQAVMKEFDVERDAIELDACETPGRVDIARMEDENGAYATEGELKRWEEGQLKLYYAVYSGQLQLVQDVAWAN